MYTGTQPWNADESLLLLYAPGQGHQPCLGQPPYSYLGQLNLPGEWAPTDLENIHWDVDDPYISQETFCLSPFSSDQPANFALGRGDEYARQRQHRQSKEKSEYRNDQKACKGNNQGKAQ